MTKIFTITNNKGGVGKTTVSTTMAYVLSKQNFKVLLIDFDSQANATYIATKQLKDKSVLVNRNIVNIIEGVSSFSENVVSINENLDLIPSTFELHSLENDLSLYASIKNEILNYDYVIIDTLPDRQSNLLENSIVISDLVIVVCELNDTSLWGRKVIYDKMKKLNLQYNNNTKICTIYNKFKKNNSNHIKFLKENNHYTLVIPYSERLANYSIKGIPVSLDLDYYDSRIFRWMAGKILELLKLLEK